MASAPTAIDEEFEVVPHVGKTTIGVLPRTTHFVNGTHVLKTVETLVTVGGDKFGGTARVMIMCDVSPSMDMSYGRGTKPIVLLRDAIASLSKQSADDGIEVKAAFGAFATRVDIVDDTYAELTGATDRLERICERLVVSDRTGQSTNHQECLERGIAHLVAAHAASPANANHLFILTDGNPKQGETNPARLERLARKYAQDLARPPILVSVLVLGRDNVNTRIATALQSPTQGVIAHATAAEDLQEELSKLVGFVGRSARPFVLDVVERNPFSIPRRIYAGTLTSTHTTHVVNVSVPGGAPYPKKELWTPHVVASIGLACEPSLPPVDITMTYVPDEAQLPDSARQCPKALEEELQAAAFERELQDKLRSELGRGGADAAESYLEREEARMRSTAHRRPNDESLKSVVKHLHAVKHMSKPKPPQLSQKRRYRDPPPSPASSVASSWHPTTPSEHGSPHFSPTDPSLYTPTSALSINETDMFMAAMVSQSQHYQTS